METEAKKPRVYNPKEYRLVCLRECNERDNHLADQPERAAAYWRECIATSPDFRPEIESMWVLFVNTRRRVKGHTLISNGTLDTIYVHAREVFRPAIVANSAAVIIMHNHPSGDPTPSEGDIKVTRDLMRGGQLLKIEVLDHVVMGQPGEAGRRDFASLRELGYLCC
jgi:DNA repair protein RadC